MYREHMFFFWSKQRTYVRFHVNKIKTKNLPTKRYFYSLSRKRYLFCTKKTVLLFDQIVNLIAN